MNEDRSVYTAVTTHMVLLKVKDGPSYALELGYRGQGGDPVQATPCQVETPARIKPEGQRYSYRTQ